MNYYEELGLHRDASVEEIRHAYKTLARLFHPDSQTDPNLKEVGERQMKRLGEIIATLADPVRRSQYDESLIIAERPKALVRTREIRAPLIWASARFAQRHRSWILFGLVALAGIVLIESNRRVLYMEMYEAALLRDEARQRNDALANTRRETATSEMGPKQVRSIAQHGPDYHSAESLTGTPELPSPDVPLRDLPPRPSLEGTSANGPEAQEGFSRSTLANPDPGWEDASLPVESNAISPRVSPFAGRWLYSPQGDHGPKKGIYQPIYMELLLVEENGELAGEYHARYKVPNRVVSPDVRLKILGARASTSSAEFEWLSAENAMGKAEIRLQGPNILHIHWWTTQFGRRPSVVSGSALMIRKLVP